MNLVTRIIKSSVISSVVLSFTLFGCGKSDPVDQAGSQLKRPAVESGGSTGCATEVWDVRSTQGVASVLHVHFAATPGSNISDDANTAEPDENAGEGEQAKENGQASAALRTQSTSSPTCVLKWIELVGLGLGNLSKVPAAQIGSNVWAAVTGVYWVPTSNPNQRTVLHVIRDHTVDTWAPATAKTSTYGLATRRLQQPVSTPQVAVSATAGLIE